MQHLDVSGAVRLIHGSLGVKRLNSRGGKCLQRGTEWFLI